MSTASPAQTPAPAEPRDGHGLVEIRGVGKRFGDFTALTGVDLTVHRGEVVVVLGPSGSGKSTLCRCVNRMEAADEGEIRVDGRPQPLEGRDLYRFRAEVGMVFQSFNLFAHRTVLANVAMGPRRILGLSRADAERRARGLLQRVGLGHRVDSYPAELSGGQSQRAAIARALAMEPKVLLFDEPTSALDPEMTREVLAVMRELADAGTTMLVVTHEMGFARDCADRVVFMDGGRVVESADPETFFTAPATARARDFLSSVN
ncbi:amino acid ABC transporter ATP-binding protein [Streptomyces sp. RFCAC02]|uniref:amino acid ABC transporter ATP-binding protein n=1 Tax=Streptomyces sp. RFCAC02 TaxID=2499143 RepID=UPI001021B301|nr:amino acid ABC transporter ATP-binding protein [Streptomyces sp. RFCAC02]